MKGTRREKILDYREPLYDERRERAFSVTSPRSFLLNAEMSVDEDVCSTLQERPLQHDGDERLQFCSKQSGTTENPPLQSRTGIAKAFF